MLELETPSEDGAESLFVPQGSPEGLLVGDPGLLFTGEFARVGDDLQLTGSDGATLTIADYFSSDGPAALVSPQGAMLTADVVEALSGGTAIQLAQSGGVLSDGDGSAADAIGYVETLTGTAQVARGGQRLDLAVGDAVYEGDVVRTGPASELGIVFIDQTVFAMADNAQMVLDSLVYNPGSSGNSLLVNAISGSFVFITGEIAPTGGIRVETPVASIGIRGTEGPFSVQAVNGAVVGSLVPDPEGHLGAYQVFDKLTGALIATIDSADTQWSLGRAGGQLRYQTRTQFDVVRDASLIDFANTAYHAARGSQQQPRGRLGQQGSRASLELGEDPLETAAGPGAADSGSGFEATNLYNSRGGSLFGGLVGSSRSIGSGFGLAAGGRPDNLPPPVPRNPPSPPDFSPPPAVTPPPGTPPATNSPPSEVTLDNASIGEGSAGAVVGTISVVDPDSGESFTYAVSDDRFEVVGGQLRLKDGQVLDFESEPVIALSVTVTDSAGNQFTQDFEIAVTNQDDPPVVDLNGPEPGVDVAAAFAEGDGAVAITGVGAGISDDDSATLAAVTVTITNLADAPAEQLAVSTAGTGVSASYDSATGVLTLTGDASLGEYQQVLSTLTYVNSSENPTAGVRSIEVVAEDVDGLTSPVATASVTVSPVNDAPVLVANSLTIGEGETVVLSSADLGVLDPDSTDLTYTVSGVQAGQFELLSALGIPITSFTQAELDAGQVLFVHDGSNLAPAYQVTVSDGEFSDSSAATISFTVENDAPVLLTNQLALSEGEAVVLTPANLSASDPDGGEADLLFTVSGVTGGQFERLSAPGVATTAFTQAEMAAGAIRFVHDGGEAAPSYDVTVSDGELSDGGAAAISFTPVNDLPELNGASLTIVEGGTAVLSAGDFSAGDAETAAGDLVFQLSVVEHGQFERVSEPGLAITAFTQAEVAAGEIRFVHDGSETAPGFLVSVSDGEAASEPVVGSVSFTSVNDVPVVDLNGAGAGLDYSGVFVEGDGPIAAVDATAVVSDADSQTLTGLTITLTNAADGGAEHLEVSLEAAGALGFSVAGNGTTSLTLSGAVSPANYQELLRTLTYDNTSASPTEGLRSIEILADDGAGSDNLSVVATAFITVSGSNSAPVLTVNQITLAEGGSVVLSAAELAATDPDGDDAGLVFTMSAVDAGQFEFVSDPGLAITSFTQAQVTAGEVRFVHDGSETFPAYQVSVTDGLLATEPEFAVVVFAPVNDAPSLTANSLTISEGATVVLSTVNLNATDPDSATLTFTVSDVQHGQFELVADPGVAVTSFTLADILAGAVQFVHTGGEDAPSYAVSVSDGLESTAPAPATVIFNSTDNPPELVVNQLTLLEGEAVTLSAANLAASDSDTVDTNLTFTVSSVAGGQFELIGDPGVAVTSFTQAEVTASEVLFVHDGSETAPSYLVSVSDGTTATAPAAADVTFTPVNDVPVLTANSLTIAEGQAVVLTTANLDASDPDGPALSFIVSGVTRGQFELMGDPGVPVTSFTLAQVIAGEVAFVHDGSEVAPAYAVAVTDGIVTTDAQAAVITFNVDNDPPELVNNQLTLLEGETVVLSSANFSASAPDSATLTFTLGSVLNGHFELVANPGSAINSFTQAQVTAGEVQFVHDGSENAPSYDVSVSDGTTATLAVVGNVTFSNVPDAPSLTANSLGLLEGEAVVLSSANLAASDPDSDEAALVFTVSNISGGQFELIADPGVAVTSFTQAEIQAGQVRFVHDGGEAAPAYEVSVSDGALSSSATPATIGFTPVNDAPEVDLNGADGAVFTEDGVGQVVDGDLTLSDVDSANLTGATVTIVDLVNLGEELLAVDTTGTAIIASYDAGTGVLTFSGSDILANYQQVLRSLTYRNLSDDPTAGGSTQRTVRLQVTDGAALSLVAVAFVDIVAVNDAPVLAAPSSQQKASGVDLVFSQANGNAVVVGDADAGEGELTVTLSVDNGTLTLATTAGLSVVNGNGGALVSLTGTLAAVNVALDGLVYSSTSGFDTLAITVDDLGNTGSGGAAGDTATVLISLGEVSGDVVFSDLQILVGETTFGSLTVLPGTVLSANQVVVGVEQGGFGALEVSGAGTELLVTSTGDFFPDPLLIVGDAGFGDLDVSAGGTVTAGEPGVASGAIVGNQATGLGLVEISSATLEVFGDAGTAVGNAGYGDLRVLDGASATFASDGFNNLDIGRSAGGSGLVVVSGAGSTLVTSGTDNTIQVGRAAGAEGTLVVRDGGLVRTLDLELARSGMGTVAIDGGTVIVSPEDGTFAAPFEAEAGFVSVGRDAGSEGRLAVLDGGQLIVRPEALAETTYAPALLIARGADSLGSVLVSGIGSLIQISQAGPAGANQGFGTGPNLLLGSSAGGGQGLLTVQNASQVVIDGESAFLAIAYGGGSHEVRVTTDGAITVDGQAGEASVNVGRNGSGLLQIDRGGALTLTSLDNTFFHIGREAGSQGQAMVSGPGSSLFVNSTGPSDGVVTSGTIVDIGRAGSGELVVAYGGQASFSGHGTNIVSLGRLAGGSGAILVDGPGSLLEVTTMAASDGVSTFGSRLRVGREGTGDVDVTNGGRLDVTGVGTAILEIGYETGSGQVTVDGRGSVLNVTTSAPVESGTRGAIVIVGREGIGHLTVTDGGIVNVAGGVPGEARLVAGEQGGSWGQVMVRGEGSALNVDGDIILGLAAVDSGSAVDGTFTLGRLEIRNGSSVSARSVTLGADDVDAGGSVLVSGGTLEAAGYIAIGTGAGSGLLDATGGAEITAGMGIDVGINGRLRIESGSITVPEGFSVSNAGQFELDSPGTAIRMDGDLVQTEEGLLTLFLGPGGSRVEVTGTATFDPSTTVRLSRGTNARFGDAMILEAAAIIGLTVNDVIMLGSLTPGLVLTSRTIDGAALEFTAISASTTQVDNGTPYLADIIESSGDFLYFDDVTNSFIGIDTGAGDATRIAFNGEVSVAGDIVMAGDGESRVVFNRDATAAEVWLADGGSGTAILVIGPGTSIALSGSLNIGHVGSGDATAEVYGNLTAASISIGVGELTTGHLLVHNGSVATTVGDLVVGQGGTGTLTVRAGGEVSVASDVRLGNLPGSSGTAIISDEGSRLLASGEVAVGAATGSASSGSLAINSGYVQAALVTIGRDGSTGTVTVNSGVLVVGSPSAVESYLVVGFAGGNGSLSVSNGGIVKALELRIGESNLPQNVVDDPLIADGSGSVGIVTLSGAGTKVVLSNDYGQALPPDDIYGGFIRVGEQDGADATLQVLSGAEILISAGEGHTSPSIQIARNPGSLGTVLIDGSGSRLVLSQAGPSIADLGPRVTVGRGGLGEMTIQNSGAVELVGDDAAVFVGRGNAPDFGDPLEAPALPQSLLQVLSGGRLLIDALGERADLIIGETANGNGRALIQDAGSEVVLKGEAGALVTVGHEGTGDLDVLAGSRLVAEALVAGDAPGGTGSVTVDGAGSRVELGAPDLVGAGGLIVGLDGSGEMTISGGGFVGALSLGIGLAGSGAPSGSLTVTGSGSLLRLSNDYGTFFDIPDAGGNVMVARDAGDVGKLIVADGGKVEILAGASFSAPQLFIARNPGSHGTVLLDGGIIELRQTGPMVPTEGGPLLQVGRSGEALMRLENGSVLLLSGEEATVLVSRGNADEFGNPADAPLLDQSRLEVLSGSTVTIDGLGHTALLNIGVFQNGDGDVLVRGAGSTIELLGAGNEIRVASRGMGEMTVDQGAAVKAQILTVGQIAGADGIMAVDGADTTVTLAGFDPANGTGGMLRVGRGGTGQLTVTNGATVAINGAAGAAPVFHLGQFAGSLGTAVVAGAGSAVELIAAPGFAAGFISIGGEGAGELQILDGGRVSNDMTAGLTVIGRAAGSSGSVLVQGLSASELSVFDAGAILVIGEDYDFAADEPLGPGTGGTGTLTIGDFGVVNAGEIYIGSGGQILGTGIAGAATSEAVLNAGTIVLDGGTIAPGFSPGTLELAGDFTMRAGSLEIELGGLEAGESDLLLVSGSAALTGGVLDFVLLPGADLGAGDGVAFLAAGGDLALGEAIAMRVSGVTQDFRFLLESEGGDLSFVLLSDPVEGDSVVFLGGSGDDAALGGAGDDRLAGGRGADTLTGGEGSDLFLLGAGDGGASLALADLVSDFEDGTDIIGLTGGLEFADLFVGEAGGSATITIAATGEILATLQGVSADLLSEADFATYA